MPADGLEAQDVGPPRCGCWVAHMAIFVAAIGFWAKHTRSREITRRLRLVTVMAGLWSVVAEAVVRACLISIGIVRVLLRRFRFASSSVRARISSRTPRARNEPFGPISSRTPRARNEP